MRTFGDSVATQGRTLARGAGRLWGRRAGSAVLFALMLLQFGSGTQEPQVAAAKNFDVWCKTSKGQVITYDDACLEIGKDCVTSTFSLCIQPLCRADLAPLDEGMTLVTRGPRCGYRMLPHGTKFEKPIHITLPFDPSLLAPGREPKDARTYFYDNRRKSWQALPLVSFDLAASTICSQTDHFTDFIVATITVPDQPGLTSFMPTQIKDLLAGDAASSINLIEPPAPSSSGSASLHYPIEVPPGRASLQASVSVGYSSSSGNGWMGLGWDTVRDSVSIETRWGVPRYDPTLETETYLLNGAQLAPLAHRLDFVPRQAEKTFQARIEGKFERIVRHGSQPSNYWWEVTDKSGTRRFYGGDPDTGGPAADSTLADANGNVFLWALRKVQDTNGNFIRYRYAVGSDPGVAGGTVQGVELYPKSIAYTGFAGQDGPYGVTFIRDSELGEARRPDVPIDCRGGFKRVTADLLRKIDVTLSGQLVRRYEFQYKEGAFRKTLLAAIIQYGQDGVTEFNRHTFDYFDELRAPDGTYQGFDPSVDWNTGNDNVTAGLLGSGQASALSGSVGQTVGGHLYVGFNPSSGEKQESAGFKIGFTSSQSDGVLALMDLNGDGLPDKIFKNGQGTFYRLNQSGPSGSTVFGPATPLASLPAISGESSTNLSFGVEAYFFANVFVNSSNTFTKARSYLTDVNGDGLTDLVTDGQVLFGRLDAQGNPGFTPDSSQSPVPIGPGAVDATQLIEDYEAIFQQSLDTYPLLDTVRRWVAPWSGTIQVAGTVALVQDTSLARSQYPTADGVRVAIQQNGSELYFITIGPNDYAPKAFTGVDAIPVQKGDRIYFRVQSVFDGSYDQVEINPEITYLNVNATNDVNNLNVYRYKASEDFTFAGRPRINVRTPLNGTVHLSGDLTKSGATTDDVTLIVTQNGATVLSQTLPAAQAGVIPVNLDIAVAKSDTLQLRVQVDSPIDLSQVQWVPNLYYTASPDVPTVTDSQGNFLIKLNPPYDIDFYPVDDLTAPQQAWTVTQTGNLTVVPQLTANPGVSGTVVFTVKKTGQLVSKQPISIQNGTFTDPSFTIAVTQGDQLFFDYSAYDPSLKDQVGNKTVVVYYGDPTASIAVPSAFHSESSQQLFPVAYRGWSTVGYNGNRGRALVPIDESLLVLQPDQYQLQSAMVYLFSPSPATGRWQGPDDSAWVSASRMSSTRLGVKNVQVPRPNDFAGARGVVRLSRTQQTCVGAGLSLLSGSVSSGQSQGLVDFIDLNGDRFPDIVGNGRVQYTTPTGGMEGANRAVPGLGKPRTSDVTQANVGVGGSPAFYKSDARGSGTNKETSTGSQMATLGLSGNLGQGTNQQREDLIDINGDGLPDRVSSDGTSLTVAFNLGYGFAPAEPWGASAIMDGTSTTFSVGATPGFNAGIYDFAGGISLSENDSESRVILVDLNGDGLPDRVRRSGGTLLVSFNTGNGFAPEVPWTGALTKGLSKNANTSLGGGFYFTIGIGPLCLGGCYLIINPGFDANTSMARVQTTLRDVDGDGYADHLFSDSDGTLTVARNRTGRTNLLRTVTRPLQAVISLDYTRMGNTSDMPHSRWTLSRMTLFDGHPGDGVDTRVTTYGYSGGRYSRLERQFLGFSQVRKEERDPTQGEAIYRTVVQDFYNDNVYTSGILRREVLFDGAGRPFIETVNTILLRDVVTAAEPADGSSTTAVIFPMAIRGDQNFYEGQANPQKTTYTTRVYDAVGNVSQFVNAGDVGPEDDVSATVSYSNFQGPYIVGKPTRIQTVSNGSLFRRREADYDPQTGNLLEVRVFLDNGQFMATDFAYLPNGSVSTFTSPPNLHGQRYAMTYSYDPLTATHATGVQDTEGYSSQTDYDLSYGKRTRAVDLNGNVMTFAYDLFGRLTSVTAPDEQGGATPTIQFEYHPEAPVPFAVTRHLDKFRNPSATIDIVQFIDGLKRPLQTKKTGTIALSAGAASQDVLVISGASTFDLVGRVTERRFPTTEPLGTPTVWNPVADPIVPTRTTYDVLDRQTQVTLPDGNSTVYQYGFGRDRDGVLQFSTSVTDPLNHTTVAFRDVRELTTAVKEFIVEQGQAVWTSYLYDGLRQLVQITDDHLNVTRFEYDLSGRRTAVDSPDKGRIEQVYDLSGNVTRRTTSNLRATNQAITYDYAFNRLTQILYPNNPLNNVTYQYGPPGAPGNTAARISKIADASGTLERTYGRLGEVIQEKRFLPNLPVPGNDPSLQTFTTGYLYDSFGRLQVVTYPDGEVLNYGYDTGGMLASAVGQKQGRPHPYLAQQQYDKFGLRVQSQLANGIATSFGYDPLNRRLSNITAAQPGTSPFQNLQYSYDSVGNILNLTSQVALPSKDIGGPTVQTYQYDSLYRLVGASGSFTGATPSSYTLAVGYDSLHNIQHKTQTVQVNGKVDKLASTDWNYLYAGPHPHAPTHVGDRDFDYDLDGNQVDFKGKDNGMTRRSLVWDEEDRVQSITDQASGAGGNGNTVAFTYDFAGQRILKTSSAHTTAYVNALFTVENRNQQILYTKHVYASGIRIASNVFSQPQAQNGTSNQDGFLFYFHGDHLNSTQFISSRTGELREHLEYLPFGETWLTENKDNSDQVTDVPYLFSGKEMDKETGLYYFGTRYYDPRTSVWQSADPIIASFKSGGSAQENSRLVGNYTYTRGHPTRFVDPDGRFEKDFHKYMTYFLATRAGIDPANARTLAISTQYTDEYHETAPGHILNRAIVAFLSPFHAPFTPIVALASLALVAVGRADLAGHLIAWFTSAGSPEHVNFIHFPAKSPADGVKRGTHPDSLASRTLNRFFEQPAQERNEKSWMFAGIGTHSFEDSYTHEDKSALTGHIFTPADDPSVDADTKTISAVRDTFRVLSRMAGNEREIDAVTLNQAMEAMRETDEKLRFEKAQKLAAGEGLIKEEFDENEEKTWQEMFRETKEKGFYKFPDP